MSLDEQIMRFEGPVTDYSDDTNAISAPQTELAADHFIKREGKEYAGAHLIIDLYGSTRLDSEETITQAFLDCIDQCGATLLHMHFHRFTPNGGISGVAVLAESHISIHTWPERNYAALDVFMCGNARPHEAIQILKNAFSAERAEVHEFLRGEGAAE